MSLSQKLSHLIKSSFNILATSLLAFLLIVLEKLMETEFTCPSDPTLGICYSCAFFFLPILVLIALSMKYSPGVSCGRCSCPGFWCGCLQVSVAPLLWCLILLTDGRYLTCFLKSATGKVTSGVKEISQIIGLILITVFIIAMLVIPQLQMCESSCVDTLKKYYFRKKHETNVLCEVERILQKGVQDKTREYVQTRIDESLSNIKADNCDTQIDLMNIIWQQKNNIKNELNNQK
ncbi:uncharacterized protein LOC128499827 [Spea bombifrons]|uniref:uncharacterized protein LOC128499827 n=1 Tax=Spea bombifrons TaxID=233779 RepID=UPI0023495C45|nr:uncharacterized protein LOC128499827 [Spea bombifrons]